MPGEQDYQLTEQVGFILRRATQRHLAIFAAHIPDLTPTQFATIAKLCELGPLSQNELGRQTAIDGATIKGVVDRLKKRELVDTFRNNDDQRRLFVKISPDGRALFEDKIVAAKTISEQTLKVLNEEERKALLMLLSKIT